MGAPARERFSTLASPVDEKTCNPLKVWHDIGEPQSLSPEQKELLQASAYPFVESRRITADGAAKLEFELSEFGVMYFELRPAAITSDRGFDYQRAVLED